MYFSKKQYFRDTTAPAGLSETIPIKNVPAVSGRFVNIRNPETIDMRNDYYGNELLTIKDRNGVVRQISLMKGANKPRGIDGKVKWSMAPNKFRRGRGLRTDTSLFYEPPKRREMGTEFFKSRYQSAFDEMLIAKKIRDSEKLDSNKIKTLNDNNKKLQDRLDATLQSNKLAQDRLAQDSLHHNQLLLAISNTSTPSVINIGTPAGNAAAALAGGGGAGGIPAPSPAPAALGGGAPAPAPAPRQPTPEEIRAFQAQAAAGGGGRDELLEAVRAAKKPSELKALRAAAKAAAAGGDVDIKLFPAKPDPEAEEPAPEKPAGVPIDFSKLPPPDSPKGKGKGKKGKEAPPPPPDEGRLLALENLKAGEGDAPSPVFAGGLAPAVSEAESAISVSDTPRTRETKLKFFGRRGLEGGLQEVDISKLDEEGVEAVGASTAFSPEEKKEILSGLKGKMSAKVRKEAEKQLKLLSVELGETAEGTIGGEKQTSTPRPPLTEKITIPNPIDDEDTDEDEPKSAVESLQKDLGKEAVKQGQKAQVADQFIKITGLKADEIGRGDKVLGWIKQSSSEAEFQQRYDVYNQYLKGVSKTPFSQKSINNEMKKKFPPAPDPPAFASFGAAEPAAEAKEDFYKPSFPHDEIGEIKTSKEFKAAHDNSKFKNPVQIKFGNPRVGGAVGVRGMMGYIADFDDVKKTFDPLPIPKEKGEYGLNAWKKARAKLDNWDMFKDQPFSEINIPKENKDGTLQPPVFTKGKPKDLQRVNEIFLPANEEYAKAFGVDWNRHEELREETAKRGGQAEAMRKFKKGELVSFEGKQVKVVSQKGDSIVIESEDGNITIDLNDLD